jgi:tol-pal system protein YbgF
MIRRRLFAVALALSLPAAAEAQNRQDLQVNAELRMLHEQVNKLQLTVNQVAEQIKVINKRLDDQTATSQKQVADIQLLINNLATTVGTVREKLDDNSVRVSQLMGELPGMRSGLSMLAEQLNTLVGLLQPPVNPVNPDAPPGTSGSALGTVKMPESPGQIFELAKSDYAGNRLPLAIDGFTEFVDKFPTAPNAAEAQFYIGQSHFASKSYKEAIEAYGRVISNYKDSQWVPEAYFQQGLSYVELKQRPQAQKIFELIIKQFPSSTAAILAKQTLTRLNMK